MSKTVCIIPARGGSKRIPGKNIKEFLGKPIIHYPIEAAKEAGVFNDIIVYTDSQAIKDSCKCFEFQSDSPIVSIMDRPEVADDQTLAEAILEIDLSEWDYICVLLPTAVFVTCKQIYNSLVALKTRDSTDGVVSIMSVDRYLKWGRDDSEKLWFDIPFDDAGQFYFIKKNAFLKHKSLIPYKLSTMEIFDSIDINTQEDWDNAEKLYRLLDR